MSSQQQEVFSPFATDFTPIDRDFQSRAVYAVYAVSESLLRSSSPRNRIRGDRCEVRYKRTEDLISDRSESTGIVDRHREKNSDRWYLAQLQKISQRQKHSAPSNLSTQSFPHLLRKYGTYTEANPCPMSFSQITVQDLAQCLDNPNIQFVDVREPWEVETASLQPFQNLPLSQFSEWSEQIYSKLDPETETLVLCHHGVRSAQMCHWLTQQGFTNVKNISGGIDAYSTAVDRSVPRY